MERRGGGGGLSLQQGAQAGEILRGEEGRRENRNHYENEPEEAAAPLPWGKRRLAALHARRLPWGKRRLAASIMRIPLALGGEARKRATCRGARARTSVGHAELAEARHAAHERVNAEFRIGRHEHAHHHPVHVGMVVADEIKLGGRERVEKIVFGLVAVHLREDERHARLRGKRLQAFEAFVRHPHRAAVRIVAAQVERVLQVEKHVEALGPFDRAVEHAELLRVRRHARAKRLGVGFVFGVEKREAVDFAGIVENAHAAHVGAVARDHPRHLARGGGLRRKPVYREIVGGHRREVVRATSLGTKVPSFVGMARERLRQRHRERGLAGALDSQKNDVAHVLAFRQKRACPPIGTGKL